MAAGKRLAGSCHRRQRGLAVDISENTSVGRVEAAGLGRTSAAAKAGTPVFLEFTDGSGKDLQWNATAGQLLFRNSKQSGYKYRATPTIMLKGQWLKELGFDVSGGCDAGRLLSRSG